MKMKKVKIVLVLIAILLQIIILPGGGLTQSKGERENFFFSGIAKEVSLDNKAIVVKDKKFFFSNETRIEDQKGNRLKISDITTDAEVAIDAVKHPSGYIIKKIVVITNRGV